MKRITAAKRIKAHLRNYSEQIEEDRAAQLFSYYPIEKCPLCVVTRGEGYAGCGGCLQWPGRLIGCFGFMAHINSLKTVRGKLNLIDKLEAELDRWASEEKS